MLVAAFTWGNLLAGTAEEASSFIGGAGDSALPVIDKVGGSVDRVNGQLDKVTRSPRSRTVPWMRRTVGT